MLHHESFQILNPRKSACLRVSKAGYNGWKVNYNIAIDV